MTGDTPESPALASNPRVKLRRRALLLAGGAVLLGLGTLWLLRAPIADTVVADQLDQRGVKASYRIKSIGPRTQYLGDVVIGDPRRPDLTARDVEVDIGWTWSGPVVSAVRAREVRAYGRWDGQRLRMGEVDKLLPAPSDKGFALPDIALDLHDARMQIGTPWGDIGARIDGAGPLQRNFAGKIALVAPKLSGAGCVAGRTTLYGDIRVQAGAPGFRGPIRTSNLRCAQAGLTARRADVLLDAGLSNNLSRWTGSVTASGSGISGGGVALDALTLKAAFDGSDQGTRSDFSGTATRMQVAGASIAATKAKGIVSYSHAGLNGAADVGFSGASLSADQRRTMAAAIPDASAGGFSALASRYGRAVMTSLSGISGETALSFKPVDGQYQITIHSPQLRSQSGARLTAAPDSRMRIDIGGQHPGWDLDGRWQLSGGGMPSANLTLRRGRGGMITGRLAMGPLSNGTARLALTPMVISGKLSTGFQIATDLRVSGPLAGGTITNLGFAARARIGPDGRVSIGGGCQPITISGAMLAGVRFGANRLSLCSAPGQPLLAWRQGRLSGDIDVPSPTLQGRTGASALIAKAARARYAVASGQWGVDALQIAVGDGAAASHFSVQHITGKSNIMGLAGTVEGGRGEIGTIPLDMADIGGDWTWQKGLLQLNAQLLVSDQLVERRFNPLVSKDAVLTFQNGIVSARASFAERDTGAAVGRSELRHDFATGVGSADLIIPSLRFNSAFQPSQLTPLALGVIANTDGTVAGQGRIDWDSATVRSRGSFTTAGSNFAAAFGSVEGAGTTIVFDDLLALHSLPSQRASLDQINPGFPVLGGIIDYQLLDSNRVRIEGGRWPFAGGELRLKPTILDFDVNAVRRLEFELVGVDAAIFLSELGFANINASGVFDGSLPVEFSGLGGRIVGGKLTARPGGGKVAYVGELTNYNLGVMANFAFNMLKSLKYEQMQIDLNGDLDGEMLTDVKISGLSQGEEASRNIITRQIEKLPIVFSVRINAPFRQLISSAKSLYDPTDMIRQNLPALIEAQRAKAAAAVQPRESESVP